MCATMSRSQCGAAGRERERGGRECPPHAMHAPYPFLERVPFLALLGFFLKKNGILNCKIEGKDSTDWKLVDGIDLVIHIFNPEKRKFYELEKMWSELIPKERVMI